MNKIIPYTLLALLCIGSVLAVMPIIDRNIDDPNLIAYFNHDEGLQMDLVWYYYTGEKRDSFQYESDYGLELLYLSDFSRLVLSKFIDFTPGTFVLLLRWLHLFFWIASILALWRLVRYHFGGYWQPLLVATLLAVRPAFPALSQNLKPEAVMLFFMIVGLDYLLRIIKNPSRINLTIAVACASIVTLIKFEGVFLLPAVAASMYFARQYKQNDINIFPRIKIAWVLPALIGLIFIIFPLVLIFFYVRQSTGLTWYGQFGFFNSVFRNRIIFYSLIAGMLLIAFSAILFILNQGSGTYLKKAMKELNTLFSYCTFVFLLFILFMALFGFRWAVNPGHFIQCYAATGLDAFGNIASLSNKGLLLAFVKNFIDGIKEFDVIIFTLFILYLFIEIKSRGETLVRDRLNFLKRVTLIIFILQVMPLMFLLERFTCYHMLPFFVISLVLIVQGIKMVYQTEDKKIWQKKLILGLVGIFLIGDVILNAKVSANSFIYTYHYQEDVVFDITKWWRKNCPPDTSVVADHPLRVYLPPENKNVKFLKYQKDSVEQLRDLTRSFKPQLVYYNTGVSKDSMLPPIEEILPGTKVQLVAFFDNTGKRYKRHPLSKYVIYKIIY